MTTHSDFNTLVNAVIAVADAAKGPVTIGLPLVAYTDASAQQLLAELAAQSARRSVSIRGIRCDAAMITKIGAQRTDIYGAMLENIPVNVKGHYFDVVEITLLADRNIPR